MHVLSLLLTLPFFDYTWPEEIVSPPTYSVLWPPFRAHTHRRFNELFVGGWGMQWKCVWERERERERQFTSTYSSGLGTTLEDLFKRCVWIELQQRKQENRRREKSVYKQGKDKSGMDAFVSVWCVSQTLGLYVSVCHGNNRQSLLRIHAGAWAPLISFWQNTIESERFASVLCEI